MEETIDSNNWSDYVEILNHIIDLYDGITFVLNGEWLLLVHEGYVLVAFDTISGEMCVDEDLEHIKLSENISVGSYQIEDFNKD